MYPLAIGTFLAAVLSVGYALLPDFHAMQRSAFQDGVAMNFCVYREAVTRFLRTGTPPATIPNASLDLPPGYRFLRQWQARTVGGYCYIYGNADGEEGASIRKALGSSLLVGENRNGVLYPGSVSVPASIPSGSVVSIVSIQ